MSDFWVGRYVRENRTYYMLLQKSQKSLPSWNIQRTPHQVPNKPLHGVSFCFLSSFFSIFKSYLLMSDTNLHDNKATKMHLFVTKFLIQYLIELLSLNKYIHIRCLKMLTNVISNKLLMTFGSVRRWHIQFFMNFYPSDPRFIIFFITLSPKEDGKMVMSFMDSP